ncbi:MAG: D-alanyl-D-alanine carboxypeptidase family protein [Oscillospiraceae bacterium]|nr:D-alanyl-D-alanine carboxypeptidase family protein [Oscillospiraceae bacterium]
MNGIKYFISATAVLIMSVFGLTRCGAEPVSEETEAPTETADSISDTSMTSDTSGTSGTSDTSVSSQETTETSSEPVSDPEEADNTWAMFLVNDMNPLPKNYDDVIETELVDDTTYRDYYMDSRMAEYMIDLLAAAKEDGVQLTVVSTYRTYDYQKNNFDTSVEYRMEKGMSYEEAYNDTLGEVQIPGHSEHNAGLAVDILSDEYNSMEDDGFEDTEAFRWLSENASDYGFILRYPKGKKDITGIVYEPWHYRFVGVYYAKDIEESGLCLEEYFEEKGWLDENGIAVAHTIYDQNPDMLLDEQEPVFIKEEETEAESEQTDSEDEETTAE